MPTEWPDEALEILREQWTGSLSNSQIAKLLNEELGETSSKIYTTGGVSARASRMGLGNRSRVLSVWSTEMEKVLRELWALGLSVEEIAVEINKRFHKDLVVPFTRNAIIGKVHRLKLPKRDKVNRYKTKVVKISKPKRARRKVNKVNKEPDKPADRPQVHKPKPTEPDTVSVPLQAPVVETTSELEKNPAVRAVMSLSSTSCRWPIGNVKDEGFHFCCAVVDGEKSYCAEHNVKAHRELKKRGQRVGD